MFYEHPVAIDETKATGSDSIPGVLLKQCASTLAPSLTKNKSLQTGQLPRQFKKAKISPVHKAGDPKIAKNYRPIFLLPIIIIYMIII